MNELQEYKDLYHDELQMTEYLNSKITNSITFLTIIGTANVLLLTNLFPIEAALWSIAYLIICFLNIIAFIITVYRFVKAYTGHTYLYFYITDIKSKCEQFKENILKQVKSQGYDITKEEIICIVNKKRENWITKEYLRCAEFNRVSNNKKSQELYKLTHTIIFNFIIVFMSFIVYIIKINSGEIFKC